MGGTIAGYIFTVVIPGVAALMIPRIGLIPGSWIVLVSVIIGLSGFAFELSQSWHRREKMLLIAGMAGGLLLFGGCAIAFFIAPRVAVLNQRQADPNNPIEVAKFQHVAAVAEFFWRKRRDRFKNDVRPISCSRSKYRRPG